MVPVKEEIRKYWDNEPCGTGGINFPKKTRAFYKAIEFRRDRLDPFISTYAQFDRWKGKRILEVGCGTGSELVRFARTGANVIGVDLSFKSADIAKARLCFCKCDGEVCQADAESLPFKKNEFDFVYSWGVLHHTPDISKAISEIHRVLKPNGEICIMLYHKPSLVTLQMYLMFGLCSFKPFRRIDDILANHHESLGTKAYSVDEARQMFSIFRDLQIKVFITSYDLRFTRNRHFPWWVGKLIPERFGWNMVIRGYKG